jgi:hypothetical protein
LATAELDRLATAKERRQVIGHVADTARYSVGQREHEMRGLFCALHPDQGIGDAVHLAASDLAGHGHASAIADIGEDRAFLVQHDPLPGCFVQHHSIPSACM